MNNKTIDYGSLDAEQRLAFCRGELPTPSVFRALLAERQALAQLLKRFVDGEYDQSESLAERHAYHDEAQTLLTYLGGEIHAHTLVPNEALRALTAGRDAMRKDAELFRWLASQCGEEFRVDVIGIKVHGQEVRWALGYEGESDLRQAVCAALIEDGQVATPSAHNENVSRHERR